MQSLRNDRAMKPLDYSCGAASLTTILREFYRLDVTEADLERKGLLHMQRRAPLCLHESGPEHPAVDHNQVFLNPSNSVLANSGTALDSCSRSRLLNRSEKESWLGGPPLSAMNPLRNSYSCSASSANALHDTLPINAARRAIISISVKSRFLAVHVRGPQPLEISLGTRPSPASRHCSSVIILI